MAKTLHGKVHGKTIELDEGLKMVFASTVGAAALSRSSTSQTEVRKTGLVSDPPISEEKHSSA